MSNECGNCQRKVEKFMPVNLLKLTDDGITQGALQNYEELAGFTAFVAALRPHNVMEIGSFLGGSFRIISKLATGKKIAIDLFEYPDRPHLSSDLMMSIFRSFAPNVITIKGNSRSQQVYWDATVTLDGDQLDFLFIDGDHRYDAVKQDFQLYSPLVKSGGWIGFHDVIDGPLQRKYGNEVFRFWNELVGEKFEFFSKDGPRGEGIGIGLYRKP